MANRSQSTSNIPSRSGIGTINPSTMSLEEKVDLLANIIARIEAVSSIANQSSFVLPSLNPSLFQSEPLLASSAFDSKPEKTIKPLTEEERTEIKNWIKSQKFLLEGYLEMPRSEKECPISQDYIFHEVIHDRQSFEKCYLLKALLLKAENPITRKKLTADEIREIFKNL